MLWSHWRPLKSESLRGTRNQYFSKALQVMVRCRVRHHCLWGWGLPSDGAAWATPCKHEGRLFWGPSPLQRMYPATWPRELHLPAWACGWCWPQLATGSPSWGACSVPAAHGNRVPSSVIDLQCLAHEPWLWSQDLNPGSDTRWVTEGKGPQLPLLLVSHL